MPGGSATRESPSNERTRSVRTPPPSSRLAGLLVTQADFAHAHPDSPDDRSGVRRALLEPRTDRGLAGLRSFQGQADAHFVIDQREDGRQIAVLVLRRERDVLECERRVA